MAKSTTIVSYTLDEIKALPSETDWEKLRSPAGLGDPDDPDDFDWTNAEIVEPAPKVAVSIRVDSDVLDFFKQGGRGYQTRINAVLRSYMKAQKG